MTGLEKMVNPRKKEAAIILYRAGSNLDGIADVLDLEKRTVIDIINKAKREQRIG